MTAIISPDKVYRYWLRRELPLWLGATPRTCLFIMLNPSTADADADDPTIRRCKSFARTLECPALEVVNLYAYRATEPRDLFAAQKTGVDIVGPNNAVHIQSRHAAADITIAAWGANAPRGRVAEVLAMTGRADLFCLDTCQDGSPRHPLYVRAAAEIRPWSPNA